MKPNTFISSTDIKLHQFHHPTARHHTLKNKNNNTEIQFDKAIIGFTNI